MNVDINPANAFKRDQRSRQKKKYPHVRREEHPKLRFILYVIIKKIWNNLRRNFINSIKYSKEILIFRFTFAEK